MLIGTKEGKRKLIIEEREREREAGSVRETEKLQVKLAAFILTVLKSSLQTSQILIRTLPNPYLHFENRKRQDFVFEKKIEKEIPR